MLKRDSVSNSCDEHLILALHNVLGFLKFQAGKLFSITVSNYTFRTSYSCFCILLEPQSYISYAIGTVRGMWLL